MSVHYTSESCRWTGTMARRRKRPEADVCGLLLIRHPATILRSLAIPIKPNPPKGGDGNSGTLRRHNEQGTISADSHVLDDHGLLNSRSVSIENSTRGEL